MNALASLERAIDHDARWLAGTAVIAALLHVGIALALPRHAPVAARAAEVVAVVDVVTPPPPPPPPPVDEPPPPEPAAEPAHAAAPSPAQAAKIVAREERADEPADLTGAFVSGEAATYAGGMTASNGTSTHVVRTVTAAAPAGPVGGGKGPPRPGAVDMSRRAAMLGDAAWKCPFPPEADGINAAAVQMRVAIDPHGKVLDATVEHDPGHGFGREATRCVRDKPWSAASDRDGVAIASSVVVMVRFTR